MIDLPFSPDLVLGPVRIAWHSIFSFLGSMLAWVVAVRLSRYLIRDERVHVLAAAVLVGGLVTARMGNIADNWSVYASAPEKMLLGGGIAVTAAPIGSTLAAIIVARRLRLPLGFMLDVAAIGIVIGLAVGRIGDVINGEHHAVACEALAWCVRYTHPDTLGQSTYVHPVVVYDGLIDIALGTLAYLRWRAVRGVPPEGRTYLLVLGLYGSARLATSFLRLDPVVLAGLQEAQILGLVYAFVAIPWLIFLERRARGGRPGRTPAAHL